MRPYWRLANIFGRQKGAEISFAGVEKCYLENYEYKNVEKSK